MKLLVHELGLVGTTLVQTITIGSRDVELVAIRPSLYIHGSPSGSLTMQIEDENQRLVDSSETLSIATIKSTIASLGYDHGYLRFLASTLLKKNTTYGVRLVPSGGYAFAEGAYVGWCNGYDLGVIPADWSPSTGWDAALDMQLWERARVIRRVG